MTVDLNTLIEGAEVTVKVNRVEVTAIFYGASTKHPGYANVEVDGKKLVRKVIRDGAVTTRLVAGHAVPAPPTKTLKLSGNMITIDTRDEAFDDDAISEQSTAEHVTVANRNTGQHVAREIKAALADVERRLGVTVNLGSWTYDEAKSFRFKNVEVVISGGDNEAAERIKFERDTRGCVWRAAGRSICPADYGKTFVVRGASYELVGFKPRGQKYRWIGRSVTGKTFKFTDSALNNLA